VRQESNDQALFCELRRARQAELPSRRLMHLMRTLQSVEKHHPQVFVSICKTAVAVEDLEMKRRFLRMLFDP
jgi:hypothetical protein